jgi:hypothetical protein
MKKCVFEGRRRLNSRQRNVFIYLIILLIYNYITYCKTFKIMNLIHNTTLPIPITSRVVCTETGQ